MDENTGLSAGGGGSSAGLFTKYLNNRGIFKNREVLRHSYRPHILPHRRPQIDSIAAILAPAIRNETPSNILIYGKTGTGKTASVKYVGAELENACREMGKACNVIHLNCELIDTQYRVLAQIANELEDLESKSSDKPRSSIPMTGWPTDQVYSELKSMVETIGGVNVIVLDEIDKLVKKSGDETLYNLTRFNSELKNAKISMIGISNDLRFTNFLDPRVLSSLSEEELVFPPYNAPQLRDILQQRADVAFADNILDEGVIPLCAALAAQEHGDARRALDLLRISGELAEREDGARVSEKHVKMAQQKIETDSLIVCVSSLPTQSKAVLYSMLILSELNKQVFTTGEVAQVYRDVAQALELDILTHRRITDLISELTMLGVINSRVVSRGRYGRTKEMWFGTGVAGIKRTLAKDERFDENRLKQIDITRFRTLFR
ncbi:ORC1-type DNA replication protein [Methanoplanus sp. FWC-SCC4]|uniref:ORC1-type DNA replication protein n=1 Tax=Methanochimaera problematica TaxID=2609417 RepID=A0AA97FEH7_9EURY|nr:ORC1-type DNA replication protein [Methanoplanus sp. FWC-SCC4]WOF17367.1 ORC1-type DNA replication protein [Methanoplanus sp. FWC-SCC4]